MPATAMPGAAARSSGRHGRESETPDREGVADKPDSGRHRARVAPGRIGVSDSACRVRWQLAASRRRNRSLGCST
jgi:hypothetical protein